MQQLDTINLLMLNTYNVTSHLLHFALSIIYILLMLETYCIFLGTNYVTQHTIFFYSTPTDILLGMN